LAKKDDDKTYRQYELTIPATGRTIIAIDETLQYTATIDTA
jgi:hypothetical protein